MIKKRELSDPNSCMSKADENEMTFVLLGRDLDAPETIRFWVSNRIARGKNKADDPQIVEALECAKTMERDQYWKEKNERRLELAEKKSDGTIAADEVTEFESLQQGYFTYLDERFPRPKPIELPKL